jgi:hypothetical protein
MGLGQKAAPLSDDKYPTSSFLNYCAEFVLLVFCISIKLNKSVDVGTLYQPKNNNQSSPCDSEI